MARKKTILITGGAGYIGSHVVKHLLESDYNTVVVDNLKNGHKEAILTDKFENADLCDRQNLINIFKKYKIDGVMHFASYINNNESMFNPSKYYKNNVLSTLNLLNVMKDNLVNNIVFASSCAVYGNVNKNYISETENLKPESPYGKTKFMIEEILKDYNRAYGINYVSLRLFNASGASKEGIIGESHDNETHLIPLILQSIKNHKKEFTIYGDDYNTKDGTCIRDYVHVEDIASAGRLAAEYLIEEGKSQHINVGTGCGTSVKEIAKLAMELTGNKIELKYNKRRKGDSSKLIANNKKALEILGWLPYYKDIKGIIKTAWNWELHRKY